MSLKDSPFPLLGHPERILKRLPLGFLIEVRIPGSHLNVPVPSKFLHHFETFSGLNQAGAEGVTIVVPTIPLDFWRP
jgi:hypothetical protein